MLVAAEHVAGVFAAGAFLRDERLDVEAELGEVAEQRVDGAHFVELDDADALAAGR